MKGFFGRLDRLQRSSGYRRFASIGFAVLVCVLLGVALVFANRPDAEPTETAPVESVTTPTGVLDMGPIGAIRGASAMILDQLTTAEGIATVSIGAAVLAAGGAAIIWLGLSLSYFGALLLGWLVAWPLMVIDGTRTYGEMLFGIVPLILALLTLLRLARLMLSGPTPVLAIARNVLAEAVRMKISLVFIVILLLLLAVVPTSLQQEQPLRFRVQQWLTYGLGLSYGVLALLTVFLTCASVTFEQRDKIIWQTMTKPVRAWEYLLGKWVGVMTLNLALLTVCAAGVFLFTEYLRYQPARGESSYMVDLNGNPTSLGSARMPSEDRRILEQQVLAARVGLEPIHFDLTDRSLDFYTELSILTSDNLGPEDRARVRQELREEYEGVINGIVQSRIDSLRNQAEYVEAGETLLQTEREELIELVLTERLAAARSIAPGGSRIFFFDLRDEWNRFKPRYDRALTLINEEVERMRESGELRSSDQRSLDAARYTAQLKLQSEGKLPDVPRMTLRYTVDSGSNNPADIYTLRFAINGRLTPLGVAPDQDGLRRVGLDQATSFDFPLTLLDNNDADRNGILELFVESAPTNARSLTFERENLEVIYDAGGYQLNFLRVIATMWLKLAFIAAVGVALSGSLSFPVAVLVTLGVLFAAESSSFLAESLEHYVTVDRDDGVRVLAIPVRAVALSVAWFFETYGSLKPAESLADGRLLSWKTLTGASFWLGVWSLLILSIGWIGFRQRQLAIYSGH